MLTLSLFKTENRTDIAIFWKTESTFEKKNEKKYRNPIPTSKTDADTALL